MTTSPDEQGRILLEVDSRGRVSIGKIARHRRYLARVEPGGVIVLEPAVVVPASTLERQ